MFQMLKRFIRGKSTQQRPARPGADDLPDIVQIETAMACNLRCPMCPVPDSKIHMEGRGAGIMKLKTYEEIIRQISGRPRNIGLTIMGEPLINKRIVEFVRVGKAAGHHIGFTTNATLLTREISEQLLFAGLDSLTVSFDGATKETYERIRIGAKHESVIQNVKTYFEIRNRINPKSRLHLHCIVSDLTRNEQEAFKNMWAEIADQVSFLTLDDWVGQLDIPAEFGFKALEPADVPKPETPPVGCHLLWDVLSIASDGQPIYCCFDYKLKSGLPSVFEQPITKTWATEIARERSRHINNTVDSEPCLSCAHWKRLKATKDQFLPA